MKGVRSNPITDEILYIANAKGITARQLAHDLGCTERWIWKRIRRGQEIFEGREGIPWINWYEGLGDWKEYKREDCNHRPIPIGEAKGCLRCLVTGFDDTKALQPSPLIPLDATLPEPPKPKETRRQRRLKLSATA